MRRLDPPIDWRSYLSSREYVASSSWLTELLDSYVARIQERKLSIQVELDPIFQMIREPNLERALRELFEFVFATLPDGCDFYLASARSIAPVTRLGSGAITLRWQVVGAIGRRTAGEVTPIRPIGGGASFHLQSDKARQLEEAFRTAGWTLDIDATSNDRELWVRAATG
jgi:hypothetical protein